MIQPRLYLVTYDISNRKRWRRVFKTLSRWGEHRQLSVFLCRLRPSAMACLQERLAGLIAAHEDRLMVVELGPAHSASLQVRTTGPVGILAPPAPVVV